MLCCALWAVPLFADGLLPALNEDQTASARGMLQGFKTNPRGPFFRIRWFCNDGTDHPASPPPCKERGGGFQHASLSPEAVWLSGVGVDVGVILAGAKPDDLIDTPRDHHRLKQLVLERYLEEVDRGWIYRLAYSYRGARQIEDEEKAGRRLLIGMLSDPSWLARRYYLATQLAAAIPHGQPDTATRQIRNLAKVIADSDARFQPLRAKIHSAPRDEDLSAVEKFLAERNPPGEVAARVGELIDLMRRQQSDESTRARADLIRTRLAGTPFAESGAALAAALAANDHAKVVSFGARLSWDIFKAATATEATDGAVNLRLLDVNATVQDVGFSAAGAIAPKSRREMIEQFRYMVFYAAGAGLLSRRQVSALEPKIDSLLASTSASPERYFQAIRYLARSTEWCRATANREFGPLSRLYAPLEPAAVNLLDHLLRSSPALPLAHVMEKLVDDAGRAAGLRHRILDLSSSAGVVGLNPGVAIARLLLLSADGTSEQAIDPRAIYVVPETVSDLKPMAGVLTLDSGNALSHTQLLAANLGIPNAAVPSSLLPDLRRRAETELFFAVTPRGVVILQDKDSIAPEDLAVWNRGNVQQVKRFQLDISKLDLNSQSLIDLRQLRAEDSGVRVGPKAANLGQLATYFPDRVAGGFVIPFGVYAEHIRRTKNAEGQSLEERIRAVFERADELRAHGVEPQELQSEIYPRLADIRERIQQIPLLESLAAEVTRRLREDLGVSGDSGQGVFIRSDTNAEDLPGFTGAGLNLTVPNQVGTANILQSIKNVWASPFSERAFEWRSRVFIGSHRVYPSVIVMRSVPSDQSGVIATINLDTGDPAEITVNVSEGVSAVVDGGVAESLLLRPDGSVRVLHQGRATYRKVLSPSGGLQNLPPLGGDAVLTPAEIEQLRAMVRRVEQNYPPVLSDSGERLPWDIEFGFEKGEFRLFQIRPLVRHRGLQVLNGLATLEGEQAPVQTVQLDAAL